MSSFLVQASGGTLIAYGRIHAQKTRAVMPAKTIRYPPQAIAFSSLTLFLSFIEQSYPRWYFFNSSQFFRTGLKSARPKQKRTAPPTSFMVWSGSEIEKPE
jgi:hypothetical protein